VPGGLTDPIAIAAGADHGLAVKVDGTVVAWGCGFNFGQCNVPGGLSGVTGVAGSLIHSLAVKGDGTVVAWGCVSNLNRGQCNVPVGLSDHSMDTAVPVAAVALGAAVIEKHLTLSRSLPGPDSAFSLEPEEFRAMVEAVRVAERSLGSVQYGPGAQERASGRWSHASAP